MAKSISGQLLRPWPQRPQPWRHRWKQAWLRHLVANTHVQRRAWRTWPCPELCTCKSLRLCCWCLPLAVSASYRLARRSTSGRWCRSATTQNRRSLGNWCPTIRYINVACFRVWHQIYYISIFRTRESWRNARQMMFLLSWETLDYLCDCRTVV